MRVRYLPPTAFPIGPADVLAALRPRATAPVEALEALAARLRTLLDVTEVYPVASGRTALALLLQTLQQHAPYSRREVVLPAYTCPSLVRVILDCGLTPQFVDVEPERLGFASGALARTLGPHTLAVIFVHPFGLPLDVRAATEATHAVDAVLIEDAAQAMGAVRRGRHVGTVGDFGLFSTGPGKPLALGGGGFLTVNRNSLRSGASGVARATDGVGHAAVLAHLDKSWQALPRGGVLHLLWAALKLTAVGILFHPWGWRVAAGLGIARAGDSEAGHGYRMQKMGAGQAVAGLRLLPTWSQVNLQRAQVAQAIMAGLERHASPTWAAAPLLLPAAVLAAEWDESVRPVFLRLPVLARDEASRDRIVASLQAHGIGAGKMYRRTLPERYLQLGVAPHTFPGAMAVARQLFTLPTHHYMTSEEQRRALALIDAQL